MNQAFFLYHPALKEILIRLAMLLVLVMMYVSPLSLYAQVELGEEDEYFLNDYLEILEDPTCNLTIDQVSSPEVSSAFIKNQGVSINTNLESVYWLKFTLRPSSKDDYSRNWLIEAYDFKIDSITFYYPQGSGGYKTVSTGDVFDFKSKFFNHKNFQFVLPSIKEETTFYLRVKSEQYVAFIFVLRTFQRFTNYALMEYYFLGFFYGIIIIIALFNLFLFLSVRDKAYLYYVFYVISIGLFSASMDGMAFQFLWPEKPELNEYPVPISSWLLILSALFYVRSFLLTYKNDRFSDYAILLLAGLKTLIFIAAFTIEPDYLWVPKFDIFCLFIVFLISIRSFMKGFKPARYFVLAFAFLFTGFFIFMLTNQRMIESNSFTIYAVSYGAVFEVVFLSVALADRIRTFKQEKEEAQEEMIKQLKEKEQLKDKLNLELEEKVKERTAELQKANEEIQRMNSLLYADKQKLEINVKDLSQARVMMKDVSFEEFKAIYPDDESCYRFLESLKWQDGFHCKECSNTNYSQGPIPFSRRCSKCSNIEVVTADTIFYRLKFPLIKAFYMLFLIANRKEITIDELSETLDLRRQTCWSFKKKVISAIEGRKKPKNASDGWSYLIMNPSERKLRH
ncbi:MAG: 7TM diverse intracellular signaling domain-containing protein [Cytophagaceae bacterium]